MEAILASGLVDEMLATSVEEDDLPTYLYNHVTNLGLQTTEGFRNLLANSRFLLGLGNPCDGPTFLEALCRGTAFINPGNRKPEGEAKNFWLLQLEEFFC